MKLVLALSLFSFGLLSPNASAAAECCRCAFVIDPDTGGLTQGCLCKWTSGGLSCTIHAGGGCTTNGTCTPG